MGLSTERKVFLGILGVAGMGLFIDQGLMGPKDASADTGAVVQEAGVDSPAPAVASAASKPAAAMLIDRLHSLGADEPLTASQQPSLGEAFSLVQLIEPAMPTLDDIGPTADNGEPVRPVPAIQPRATDLPALTAVMPAAGGGGGAVLGGRMVRVGEAGPGGYILIQVKARSVLLERDSRRYTIEIPMQGGN